MAICSITGCGSDSRTGGFCNKHALRLRHTGTTDPGPKAQGTIEDRFSRLFQRLAPNECWPWLGAKARGYGRISVGAKSEGWLLAHRVAWEIANNCVIPLDMVVMHSCDNPPCVNPSHLKLGTQSENVKDMQEKRRHFVPHAKGIEHHSAIFTEAQVKEIRASNESAKSLARKYGVGPSTVRRIQLRKTWKHI